MMISDLFKKDIHRNIQGVIKIGQDTDEIIQVELDEYVVTKELNRHFDKFFESYRKGVTTRTDKIGVWISGFFGSGKSHFLKILSYLLSNETYANKRAIEFFEDKIADNRILADMKLAENTSADVILFNIDAKSDAESKINKDAIVKVFMKVFNEMQGFCGSMPWLADLERQMTKEGVYESFKTQFEKISGITWESGRNDFYFEEDNIIKALSETTRMSEESARNWYNKAEANYSLDVTGFSKRVSQYIEAKSNTLGKNHFVIFLCDELGQYIGSDNNLMLNLQTVVENLGVECGGRAWVIATSQQDIDSITKVNRDNFSKIIGRFDTRLSLSSANVDEVIKKRLLAKTETATHKLKLLYEDKNSIIKNLITFSHDTPEKKLYSSELDFVDVYPFVPYQFNLLQAVFTGIRTHGASGKHLSEGERSLLNAFQEAAIQFGSFEDGTLIPFDAFYKTIETFLDHNIRTVIIHAEENNNLMPDDINILKVLFMIKYIQNVLPANIENIATIMLTNIEQDKIQTKKNIDASLRRLEHEKLITKNGDQYIFLTNEEQDINREIREIKIETSEIIDSIGEVIFSVLFGDNKKYRYSNNHDFAFNTFIDDRARGSQKEEIGIRVLTPYYSIGSNQTELELKSLSMRERNAIVNLPADMSFIDEMEQALQIDAFTRRNYGKTSTEAVEVIKATKIIEAKERRERCKQLTIEALKKADIYVNQNKLDIREKAHTERINDALKALVESIYTKLDYITKPFYSNDNLKAILTENENQLVLGDVASVPNHLAIDEMTDVITRSSYKSMQTTMKTIVENFSKAPYGWKDTDIAGILLTLFKKQITRLELAGESIAVTDLNVVNYVTKRDYLDRILIKIRIKIPPALIANAKELSKEVFGISDLPGDEDGLIERFKELALGELYENTVNIKDLLAKYANQKYPGKSVLESGRKLFETANRIKSQKEFYDYLLSEKEAFLDYEEDVQDIKKFFNNQKAIFDNAIKMLDIYEGNRSYVLDNATISVVDQIDKIVNLTSPYAEIHKLPELIDVFRKRFGELLDAECVPIKKDIEADFKAVTTEMNERGFVEKFASSIRREFDGLLERLETASNIYQAIAMREESERLKLRFINRFKEEEDRINALKVSSPTDDIPTTIPVRKTKTVSVKTLFSGTNQISNKDDINKFVEELRTKLESQLEENTTIRII